MLDMINILLYFHRRGAFIKLVSMNELSLNEDPATRYLGPLCNRY